ncbi:MAG TPA: hypothetical protein P5084_01600 [Paludibacter sp.]|nr:hypothetical protein [Paludibacter sp.]
MRKQILFAVSIIVTLFFTSCNKDLTALDPSLFKCTPNPLEEKGGKINATITGNFPEKYFAKNATVTVTPVLKFNGKQVKGQPAVFQGEKVIGNDKTISYKTGGTYSMPCAFDYVPDMAKSELFLEFSVATSKKTYEVPAVKVADGVIATSQLAYNSFINNSGNDGVVIVADKFQRIIKEMQEADILFLIQQSSLRTSETKSADVLQLTKKIKEVKETQNKSIAGFEISGYASPDGGMDLNTNLAEKRQKVTSDFVAKELKKLKSKVTIDTKFTAEDWDGFQKLMEASNIQDKEVILRVLSMYSDPEQRETEIKNLSYAFKSIAEDILPKLRRSRMKLTVDVTGKSDTEIADLAKTSPSKLNVEELLYAATLTENPAEKAVIYQKVIELYPSDARGYNNLSSIKNAQGKTEEAADLFEKALAISPADPDLNYNAGVYALAKRNVAKAEEYFGKSVGTVGNLGNALGSLYIMKGDYAKAKSSFGDTETNNAALLQILNKDYSLARNTLSGIKNANATSSYLAAILGARTNDRDAVYSNLKNAIAADKSFAVKAITDLEFSKYFTDQAFLSIVR